ncbi:MAG: PaaI family thioesterase [Pyrinomonadaceae bacterium]
MEYPQFLENTLNNELVKFLGIDISEATRDRVVLSMEVTPKVHQYLGIMNGGVSMYLCETAASIGAVLASDLNTVTPVGIEINANHLRAVSKGTITVEAKPIYHGRTMSVWSIEITNDRGKLVCVSRISILLRKGGVTSVLEKNG